MNGDGAWGARHGAVTSQMQVRNHDSQPKHKSRLFCAQNSERLLRLFGGGEGVFKLQSECSKTQLIPKVRFEVEEGQN